MRGVWELGERRGFGEQWYGGGGRRRRQVRQVWELLSSSKSLVSYNKPDPSPPPPPSHLHHDGQRRQQILRGQFVLLRLRRRRSTVGLPRPLQSCLGSETASRPLPPPPLLHDLPQAAPPREEVHGGLQSAQGPQPPLTQQCPGMV